MFCHWLIPHHISPACSDLRREVALSYHRHIVFLTNSLAVKSFEDLFTFAFAFHCSLGLELSQFLLLGFFQHVLHLLFLLIDLLRKVLLALQKLF